MTNKKLPRFIVGQVWTLFLGFIILGIAFVAAGAKCWEKIQLRRELSRKPTIPNKRKLKLAY